MADIQRKIEQALREAVGKALGQEHAQVDPVLRPANNPKFGDYQANLAMGLAKQLGHKPRDLAQKIVDALDATWFETVQVAGPGFINLTLKADALAAHAQAILGDERLGMPRAQPPRRVVVDYSGPNVAKEMHVGHLRSTIIGDAIARVLAFQGQQVIRQNHLGDWGTQFGMLIEYMIDIGWLEQNQGAGRKIADLDKLYKQASVKFKENEHFAARARKRVVAFQAGDQQSLALWRDLVEESKKHFNDNYARLHVLLTDDDVRGESFYNDQLPGMIEKLDQAGQLKQSQGATVVYPQGFKDRDGEPMPMIVRKSDGGYLYATTDLAAALHCIDQLSADWIIYVTDARQAQHFAMVFQVLRQTGWASQKVRLDYVPFGTILGKDRKPFKTRSGQTVKLAALLDEAEQRAQAIIDEKNPDMAEHERKHVAHVVAIGALKYADLASDRIKDYVFDFDRMLAMEGNTAPYLQNAYVRIRSIFRKGGLNPNQAPHANAGPSEAIRVEQPAERALVLKLLQFSQVVATVADTLEPHRLCNYLYELATAFHQFYEKCPVLAAESEALRDSRLALCQLTAKTLRVGLGLLGIDVVQRM